MLYYDSKGYLTGLLIAVLCVFITSMASAAPMMYDATPDENDVFYPYWNRGMPATATYFWNNWSAQDEDNQNSYFADDVIGNVNGRAILNIGSGGAGLIGGGEWTQPAFGSATNFWDMGTGGNLSLILDDPAAGTNGMDIWIQVKYHVGIASIPTINVRSVSGDGVAESSPTLISNGWYYQDFVESTGVYGDQPTGWMVYQTLWRLDPGQTLAGIDISTGDNGAIIDQIVIDTQILPESSTVFLAILGAGGLALLRKARLALSS